MEILRKEKLGYVSRNYNSNQVPFNSKTWPLVPALYCFRMA